MNKRRQVEKMKAIQLKGKYEYQNKPRRYERTYYFYDEGGKLYYSCDVYGQCISAPTVYKSTSQAGKNFIMTAKGKLLNATYYLEDESDHRFAAITRKGVGFRWKFLDNNDREIARIIDPASKKEAFFRTLFAALPDGYAIVSGDLLVATISKEKLSDNIEPQPKNIVGKLLHKAMPPRGLTLRFEKDRQSALDLRMVLAGLTLLQVHDITGVNR